MTNTIQNDYSITLSPDDTIKIAYDPYANYSQWRLDEYYTVMSYSLKKLLKELGLNSYLCLNSSDITVTHIEKLNQIAYVKPTMVAEVREFAEVLENIEKVRYTDAQAEHEYLIDYLKEELTRWDSSHYGAISRKKYDVLALELFSEEMQNMVSHNLPWECVISDSSVELPGGERIHALEEHEANYMTRLFSELSLTRPMDDNIQVLELFRTYKVADPSKLAQVISEVYYILEDSYNYFVESPAQEWEKHNPNLDAHIFELLLQICNENMDTAFLETIAVLTHEWHGDGKDLLKTAHILHTKNR